MLSLAGQYGALLALMLLFIGGLLLILAAMTSQSDVLARRVDQVKAISAQGRPTAKHRAELSSERHQPLESESLTPGEQRQIVRSLTPLGVPVARAVQAFILIRVAAVLVFALGVYLSPLAASGGPRAMVFVAIGAILGWFAPLYVIRRMMNNHSEAVSHGLPDALELLAVCVEAGLSLENALQRVSRELMASHPALASELSLTWAEIIILPSREKALLNMADRLDLPSVRSVVGTLAQTMRFGTPLAHSLRVVSSDLRNEQMTKMEERANRLPAMMTIPVMLFIMPTIFLVVGGPAALKVIDAMSGQ